MTDAMAAGLQLTVLGMGLVFLLLVLPWGRMVFMVRFDRAEPAVEAAPAVVTEPEPGMEPALCAAIVIAIMRQRNARQPVAPERIEQATGHWVEIGRARQHQPGSARRRG